MKIETIVNYGVPDEDKALLADIKGHRQQDRLFCVVSKCHFDITNAREHDRAIDHVL